MIESRVLGSKWISDTYLNCFRPWHLVCLLIRLAFASNPGTCCTCTCSNIANDLMQTMKCNARFCSLQIDVGRKYWCKLTRVQKLKWVGSATTLSNGVVNISKVWCDACFVSYKRVSFHAQDEYAFYTSLNHLSEWKTKSCTTLFFLSKDIVYTKDMRLKFCKKLGIF